MRSRSTKAPSLLLLAALVWVACQACGGVDEEPQTQAGQRTEEAAPPSKAEPVMDGPEKLYDARGRLMMEGTKRQGLRHGHWVSYFPDGKQQSQSEYDNGELNGITIVYRENGAVFYTGQYRHGEQVGTWKFFDEQGELERVVEFEDDRSVINDH